MSETGTSPKWMRWAGIVASAVPVLMLVMSAGMKLSHGAQVVEGMAKAGFKDILLPLGIVELLCTVIYVVPQTAVLGAILLTGYLGGAIVTHVRLSDPFVTPLLLGVLVWGGLFLRDERLRALLPLRKRA